MLHAKWLYFECNVLKIYEVFETL